MEKLLNEREMAQRLSCGERHLRRMRQEGKVPYVRLGSLVRYDPAAVGRALERYVVEPTGEEARG
ncbi:hypothetical protein BH09VER1_BH09VER1_40270 [soil metagenome]